MQRNFEFCLAQARTIVRSAAALLQPDQWMVCGGFSNSQGSGSNVFNRSGTSTATQQSSIPSFISGLLPGTAQRASSATMQPQVNSFLSGLLSRDNSQLGGTQMETAIGGMTPQNYDGRAVLTSQTSVDPMSDEYRTNTYDKYLQSVRDGVAATATGPNAVRGAAARQGFAESDAVMRAANEREDVIRQHRATDAGIVQGAVGSMNQIELQRRGALMEANRQGVQNMLAGTAQSLSAAEQGGNQLGQEANILTGIARLLQQNTTTTTENLRGAGSQESGARANQLGLNCCYIYMEAFNGTLPPVVRRARDLFAPESSDRRIGYIWMSKWLVPAMQKFAIVRVLVNETMIKPSIKYATWFFNEDGNKQTWKAYGLVVKSWFKVWEVIGKVVR